MRTTYRVLANLIALGVLLQAATIAYAWFRTINEIEDGLIIDKNYDGNVGHTMHGTIGMMVIPALALILLIISFFARVPGGVKWAGIVFGLTVLQVFVGILAFSVPIVGALHGINALAMIALAGIAGRKAAQAPSAETVATAAATSQ